MPSFWKGQKNQCFSSLCQFFLVLLLKLTGTVLKALPQVISLHFVRKENLQSCYYVIGLFVSLDICIWKRCNCSVVWRSSCPYSYSTNNLQLNIGVSMCYGGVASYFCGQSLGCRSGENPFLQPIIYRVIVTENI